MAKATHKGTCQWCNRVQMLPNGVLARHGYNIRWGWQAGVCSGSDNLPYQESCEMVERSIAWARERAEELNAKADAVLASQHDEGNVVWINVYHPELSSRSKGSVRVWEQHEVFPDGGFGGYFMNRGKKERLHQGFGTIKATGATAYSRQIRHQAEQLQAYAAEQAERISNWAPAPLLPLK